MFEHGDGGFACIVVVWMANWCMSIITTLASVTNHTNAMKRMRMLCSKLTTNSHRTYSTPKQCSSKPASYRCNDEARRCGVTVEFILGLNGLYGFFKKSCSPRKQQRLKGERREPEQRWKSPPLCRPASLDTRGPAEAHIKTTAAVLIIVPAVFLYVSLSFFLSPQVCLFPFVCIPTSPPRNSCTSNPPWAQTNPDTGLCSAQNATRVMCLCVCN